MEAHLSDEISRKRRREEKLLLEALVLAVNHHLLLLRIGCELLAEDEEDEDKYHEKSLEYVRDHENVLECVRTGKELLERLRRDIETQVRFAHAAVQGYMALQEMLGMMALVREHVESTFSILGQSDLRISSKRRRYIARNHEEVQEKVERLYFGPNATDRDKFARRFRIRLETFQAIRQELIDLPGFKGDSEISPEVKMMAALKQLGYGLASDAMCDIYNMGETTAQKCLVDFCTHVNDKFGERLLRKPTAEDLLDIERKHREKHGFPGMAGSLDCMHLKWKNCPKQWAGAYLNRKGWKSIILEVVADCDRRIWHCFVGIPGANNDLNVLQHSSIFDDILNEERPQVPFTLAGERFRDPYLLTDGIYPTTRLLVPIPLESHLSEHMAYFKKLHASARKDVECTFGILKSKFRCLERPAEWWTVERFCSVVKTCCILHNMCVEANLAEGIDVSDDKEEEALPPQVQPHVESDDSQEPAPAIAHWVRVSRRRAWMEDNEAGRNLREMLAQHMWNTRAPN